jgi:hypothetical protein
VLHVGLDLSRKRVDVCLISSEGELVEHFRAPSDRDGLYGLSRRVAVYDEPVRGVVESMNGARFVHDELVRYGWGGEDALITAICKFDFLTNALTLWRPETTRPAEATFPYYAAWDGERVTPLVRSLISSTDIRQTLLPEATDTDLASLLEALAHRADRGSQGLGSWQFWQGFSDSYVQRFIAKQAHDAT